jgi:hypothetical protein
MTTADHEKEPAQASLDSDTPIRLARIGTHEGP